jgi:N-acetylneuraminate synthase
MIIDGIEIGEGHPTFIIAEIAQAHDGSLGTAHAYIDAVARTGVDAIKFQTHIASAESTIDEKFRINCFPQDATRYDYWERMEFSAEEWAGLAEHSKDKGLIFLSTPFSIEAADLLNKLNVPAWKIGSGEISNYLLLEYLMATRKPMILSTGMSSWSEIDDVVDFISKGSVDFALLQCSSVYPCPVEQLGLNVLKELAAKYRCPVGLSDHSGLIFPGIAAAVIGANIVEVHAVFSRDCFGPDVTSSLTIPELSKLVEGIHYINAAIKNPVDKNIQANKFQEMRNMFNKSIYIKNSIKAGHILDTRDLIMKKPGNGILGSRLYEVVGKQVLCDYAEGEMLRSVDLK